MKYAIAGLLTLPFVLASAWMVGREGAAFRRAAGEGRKERLLARAIPSPDDPPPRVASVPVAPAPIEAAPARPPGAIAAAPVATVPPISDAIRAAAPPAALVLPPAAVVEPAPPPRPAEAVARLTSPLDGKDPASLSPEDERAVGRALHEAILLRHRAADSGPLRRRLLDASRPIQAGRKRKEIDYTFTVLESDGLNAFSHPGGYVYVSRGIFSLVADDSELQFLVGHEIAHVDLKHDLKLVAEATRLDDAAGRAGPGLLQRLYRRIAQGHTDEQEYEADAWAFARMLKADHTAYQSRRFLVKYLNFVENNGGSGGRKPPTAAPDAGLQDVENQYPSHPPALERLERLRAMKGGG